MIHMTLRQAKMFAKKADGPFTCYIDTPNGFYGWSTIVMFHGEVCIMAPHQYR